MTSRSRDELVTDVLNNHTVDRANLVLETWHTVLVFLFFSKQASSHTDWPTSLIFLDKGSPGGILLPFGLFFWKSWFYHYDRAYSKFSFFIYDTKRSVAARRCICLFFHRSDPLLLGGLVLIFFVWKLWFLTKPDPFWFSLPFFTSTYSFVKMEVYIFARVSLSVSVSVYRLTRLKSSQLIYLKFGRHICVWLRKKRVDFRENQTRD